MLEAADAQSLRAILDEDVEWDVGVIQVMTSGSVYHGPDGVLDFFREWVSAFADWGYAVGELFEVGDCVVVELTQWGSGRASGARVENHWWQVWKMRDGKAVRGTNHQTREEALAATAAR